VWYAFFAVYSLASSTKDWGIAFIPVVYCPSLFCPLPDGSRNFALPMIRLFLASVCLLASYFAPAQQYFQLEKLPVLINSPYDEITPVLSRDGTTLYFTRVGYPDFDRTLIVDSVDKSLQLPPDQYMALLAEAYTQINEGPVISPVASSYNQDTWIAYGDTTGFTQVTHPGPPLNNALPNSVVTITPDPNALYVINQYLPNGNMDRGFSLVRRTTDSTGWTFPQPITIKDYYTISSEVNLTMSFDGKVLILSAVRADSRDMDLYICFREGPNVWSAPQSLGNVINSAQRETTPFLAEDNVTLYFSSNRKGSSAGGNDIFYAKRLDKNWQNWSEPMRMDDPINSLSDDSQPYFNTTTGYLYFTSRRAGGSSDIFRVRIAPPQPTEMPVMVRVINRQTNRLEPGSSIVYESEEEPANRIAAPTGTLNLKIPRGVPFRFTAVKTGFHGSPDSVYFRRDYYYFRERYLDLYLDPLQVADKIDLLPIYFQQSKATILQTSYGELDKLHDLLVENPNLRIRIEGYTDNIGRAEDLMKLSQERAEAIKTFLTGKGIEPTRIETIGYGAKKPLTDNTTDEMRSKNRRVEIVITKI